MHLIGEIRKLRQTEEPLTWANKDFDVIDDALHSAGWTSTFSWERSSDLKGSDRIDYNGV